MNSSLPFENEEHIAWLALRVADNIPAMVAYWDRDEVCQFANEAYSQWFGRSRADLLGKTLQELLGALYEFNLPFIRAALNGTPQQFERRIPMPDGTGARESAATYIPDIRDGVVLGMYVHVSDIGALKAKERELTSVIEERDLALAEVRTLRGLLAVCASCKHIRDEGGAWVPVELYVTERTHAQFSHGLCPDCEQRLYPEFG